MFKFYKELADVVSVLVYCPTERSYLLTKEANGEFWLPSSKTEMNCWKMTAHKIIFELFGVEPVPQCVPLRIYKVWLPNHPLTSIYHAVYKILIKSEVKKRTKIKAMRNRLQWLSAVELERLRAHSSLRSPEVALFALMASGESKNADNEREAEFGLFVEICEDNVIISADVAGGAVALASPNYQLVQAANYCKEDQFRMYREFLVLVYPALYMSPQVFCQFMVDLGWQRTNCASLFRAADVTSRGGLSFLEFVLWAAALEPATPHSGLSAEIRCRYIFRYFDSNRDTKLEYTEFKELVAAARAARQLSVDALSVSRDADVVQRQLGMQANSQLPLAEFLRCVGEQRLRGTSSLLRAPRSVAGYLLDLQEREREMAASVSGTKIGTPGGATPVKPGDGSGAGVPGAGGGGAGAGRRGAARPDYSIAAYTVRLRRGVQNELVELNNFDDDVVSSSTARLVPGAAMSLEVLGPATTPIEALTAVHYFAAAVERPSVAIHKRASVNTTGATGNIGKAAWSWYTAAEEARLGAMLFSLAEAVRPICSSEPRLLRLSAPVYAIGDLHGNLSALLSLEAALWPTGTAMVPGQLLFLGDFVDRGPHSTEVMAYLLAAKLQRPRGVLLVRGNHETRDIQKMFTFHTECLSKYGDVEGAKIWNAINQVFDVLPLAAVVDDKVFCCHGGIPPPWVCPLISAIDKVPVNLSRPAEQSTIAWELLWNDPIKQSKMTGTLALELTANEGFAANAKRGTGHVFDRTALDRFLLANQLSHVVRAHELQQQGFMCTMRGKLVSVFSSSHYCGGTNDCSVALLDGGKIRLIRVTADF